MRVPFLASYTDEHVDIRILFHTKLTTDMFLGRVTRSEGNHPFYIVNESINGKGLHLREEWTIRYLTEQEVVQVMLEQ